MSALPFLTPMPPSQSGGTLDASTNNPNPASSLASNTCGGKLHSPLNQTDTASQGAGEGESNQSFWDTLQQQAASSDPSYGQTVSAYSELQEHISIEAHNESGLDGYELTVEEIEVEEIQVQGLEPAPVEIPALLESTSSPWNVAAMQTVSVDSQNIASNPAMDQIISQRQAQPQIHAAQAGVLTTQALQTKVVTEQPVAQVEMGVMSQELNKATQPMLAQVMQSSVMDAKTATKGSEGIKLTEGLITDVNVNIHEKPLTLTPQDTITPVNTASTASLTQDISLAESVDNLEGIQTNLTQTNKDLTQSSKMLSPALQNSGADKVLAGQTKIDVPPSNPQFTDQVAQRIGIMATEQLQTARIQLDPPELGSLEIKIRVQQDQVSVAFSSGHQVVRDALESQAPRLREMLEQQGVELTDVNVSDQQQKQTGEGGEGELTGQGGDDWNEDDMEEASILTEAQSDSLVDYFA